MGDSLLSLQFLDLYRYARNLQANMMDTWKRDADRTLWGPIFRRNMLESEEGNLINLLDKLGRVFIPEEGKESRVWVAIVDGVFSVSSFFVVLSTGHSSQS